MKKIVLALSLVALLTTSCVSKKKFVALEAKNKEIAVNHAYRFFKEEEMYSGEPLIALDQGDNNV